MPLITGERTVAEAEAAAAPDRPHGPTWVYLLAHTDRDRFKLGHTAWLSQRLTVLGARELDLGDCWAVALPTTERARQIERALHRFLDPYRLRGLCVQDGYTEWFQIRAMPLALHLLRRIPLPVSADSCSPLLAPVSKLSIEGKERCSHRLTVEVKPLLSESQADARAYASSNSPGKRRVERIVGVIQAMARHWALQWCPVHDEGTYTASRTGAARAVRFATAGDLLVVVGFRRRESLTECNEQREKLRRRVLESSTWELVSGQAASTIVATMEYGKVRPDDLLLRLRPRPTLRAAAVEAKLLKWLWASLARFEMLD